MIFRPRNRNGTLGKAVAIDQKEADTKYWHKAPMRSTVERTATAKSTVQRRTQRAGSTQRDSADSRHIATWSAAGANVGSADLYLRNCSYCSAQASNVPACGSRYYNTSYLDSIFAPFQGALRAKETQRLLTHPGRLASVDGHRLFRFRVQDRVLYQCGPRSWHETWALRLLGVAFTLGKFFAEAECARGLNFDFFLTLNDGPLHRLVRRPDGSTAARMDVHAFGTSTVDNPWFDQPFALFSISAMPGEYADIPLPWHDVLQAQPLSTLDISTITTRPAAAPVCAIPDIPCYPRRP
jgi:hypothetical protein